MNKKFVYEYIDKRQKVINSQEAEQLRDKLYNLKKEAISHLDDYVQKAISALRNNGCKVYLAKTNDEAISQLRQIIGQEKYIVKSKSNTINKLELDKNLATQIIETDTGDFLATVVGKKDPHPVIPAINIPETEMSRALKEKFNVEIPTKPEAIVKFVREYLREKILSAKTGLTGANAITTQGQIVILENEGNISLLSHAIEKHIVVAGIEKIVKDMDEANKVVKGATVWGTGQDWPVYVSVIAGPSKTGDIQNELVVGAHGAKEVHIILVDDNRSAIAQGPYRDKLFCINCGACYDLCPIYNTIYELPKYSDFERNFKCTLCSSCNLNCPVKIDWQELTRMARAEFVKTGQITNPNQKMIDNIRKFGNPFGELPEGATPKELYCC